MKHSIILISFFLLTFSVTGMTASTGALQNNAALGFNFTLKRIVYTEDHKNGTSVELSNESDQVYLMNAAILLNDPDTNLPIKKTAAEAVPFIMLPPLYKFEPKSRYSWRIHRIDNKVNSQKLPEDRESLFWIAIQALPQTDKKETGVVLTPTFYFKLLYRPKAIAELDTQGVIRKVKVNKTADSLYLENQSPLYITFDALKVGNVEINNEGHSVTLKPFSTKNVPIPANASGAVTWQLSDENLFPVSK